MHLWAMAKGPANPMEPMRSRRNRAGVLKAVPDTVIEKDDHQISGLRNLFYLRTTEILFDCGLLPSSLEPFRAHLEANGYNNTAVAEAITNYDQRRFTGEKVEVVEE